MTKRDTLLRYLAIIRRVSSAPATLSEINSHLDRESEIHGQDLQISKRTFQRDLDDISSIFHIVIEYDFSLRKYKLQHREGDVFSQRILDAFETLSVLTINREVSSHFDFEKSTAGGLHNFHGLLHAVKNRYQVNFMYQSYDQIQPALRKTNPLFLKEFKGRWYLIARNLADNQIKTYALDRLSEPDITRKRFPDADYKQAREMFNESFGIISSVAGSAPKRVVLSFDSWQGKYIKSQPLHHSQKELVDNDTEYRVELFVHVAFDLIKELLSFGPSLKVIEPPELVTEVKGKHEQAFHRYL